MRKGMKGIIRHFLACGMALLLTLVLPFQVYAGQGVIQITLKDLQAQNSNRNEILVEVYRVGNVDEDGRPVFDEVWQIAEYPQSTDALDAVAKKLADKITGSPVHSGKTNVQGTLRFEGVENGIYLIQIPSGNSYGEVKPFLVQLPYYEEVNGEMQGPVYEVEAQPKASPYQAEKPEKPEKPGEPGRTEEPKGIDKPVKTGDASKLYYYIETAVLALLVILTVITVRKKYRKNEREKA